MPAPIAHIEFRSSDFGRTSAFYAKLFEWRTEQNASSTYMKLGGDGASTVSGGWVRAELSQAPGPLVYIAVDDLASKLAAVEEAGGRVIAAKLPFAGGGEIALFADPDGNVIGLWAPKDKDKEKDAAPRAATVAAPAAPAAPAASKAAAKPPVAAKAAASPKPKPVAEKKAPKKR
jgi:predicted enzyme related to lactoylglutathione lyase